MITDAYRLLNTLNQLLSLPRESATVEFKSNWDYPEDIGEYLSALANAAALESHDRAWMVWGVDNRTHSVLGTTFDPFATKGAGRQPLIMWLTQLISPRPDFQFHEVAHPGGRVVMLEIHPPRSVPLAFKGVRYIRIDSHKSRLSEHPAREARLWKALGGAEDWSGHTVPEATLNDLDPEAIAFARVKFGEYLVKSETDSGRHEKILADVHAWDPLTLLNKARITKQGHITHAALLLLGRDEAAHFLAPADVKISWILHDGTNRPIGGQHFSLPLLLAPNALFKRIRNITLEYMPDGTLFPTPAVRPTIISRRGLRNGPAKRPVTFVTGLWMMTITGNWFLNIYRNTNGPVAGNWMRCCCQSSPKCSPLCKNSIKQRTSSSLSVEMELFAIQAQINCLPGLWLRGHLFLKAR